MEEQVNFSNEKFSASIWKKIIKLVLKRPKIVILMALSLLFCGSIDVAGPIVLSNALKVFFGDNPDFTQTNKYIIILVAMAIGMGIGTFFFVYFGSEVEVEVGDDLRRESFHHLQELSFDYYDKNSAGWIMARLTSDSRRLANIISWGLLDLCYGAVTMIGILVVLYIYSWALALVITIVMPIAFYITIKFRKIIIKAWRKVRNTNSNVTAAFNEGILGSQTTKTLVLEDKRRAAFSETAGKMKKYSINATFKSSLLWPVILMISWFTMGVTIRLGVGMNLGEFKNIVLSVSVLYLFINYTTMFFGPIMQMSQQLAELQQAQASAERIIQLIEEKPSIRDSEEVIEKYGTLYNPKYENFEPLHGDIEFSHVNFGYNKTEPILKDFNLKVHAGQTVALVGSTGSGKSTIVNLLCRFYEPNSGRVLIDGVDYKSRSISWLHSSLGYVLQNPQLFSGTIRSNIQYGKLDATDTEIKKAMESVNALYLLKKLPNGLDTNVGEGGAKLSVGEKQLISFARAIISDPKLLILDEATSSIDTETEAKLQSAIKAVQKGRTSFVVAHRLSTVVNADLILVIKKGVILEQGNHRELLNMQGEYYQLYRNQFINSRLEESAK